MEGSAVIHDILKWNDTDIEIDYHENLSVILHQTALKYPNRIAAVDEKQQLTYEQLDQYSNAVCNFLLDHREQITDGNICVYVGSHVERFCYIIGILKAGMTYVPMDIHAPASRNCRILNNVQADFLLTDQENLESAKEIAAECHLPEQKIFVRSVEEMKKMPMEYRKVVVDLEHTIYIIHTSGSTGNPKGVKIPERALLNFCWSIQRLCDIHMDDRTCAIQSFCFDVSIMDMFPFFLSGACVYSIPDAVKQDIHSINQYMIENGITMQTMTTALYHLFLEEENPVLKKLFVIGEKMVKFKPKSYEIYNMYGPTEATVLVTFGKITEQTENIPIGAPIDNTKILIIREDGTIADTGEQGEICILGANLSSGYINNEEETKKRFVPSVLDPSQKMYRTGDIGEWTDDGDLLCFGRMDFQIKHRGYRIELDEIKHYVLEIDEIVDCAVLYNDHHENPYIVCFYCTNSSEAFSRSFFVSHLNQTLPEYMIPSKWIRLQQIPLNQNGKIDRNQLFELLDRTHEHTKKAEGKENSLEQQVREIWADILDVDSDFEETATFNGLGGHSILAMIMLKKIKEQVQVDVNFADFLNTETFGGFLAFISQKKKENHQQKEELQANFAQRYEPFALNQMQAAYLVGRNTHLPLGTIPTHMYNEILCESFQLERFIKALQVLWNRHDLLRVRVYEDGTEQILPEEQITAKLLRFEDVSEKTELEKQQKIQETRLKLEEARPNMAAESLAQMKLIQISKTQAVFFLYLDGMLADGWSQEMMLHELDEIYAAPTKQLKAPKHLFRDFNQYLEAAKKEEHYEKSKQYWESQFSSIRQTPVFSLLTDPQMVFSPHIEEIDTRISEEVWNQFEQQCTAYKVTSANALYSLFGLVLSQWSQVSTFNMNMPIQKRFFDAVTFDDIIGNCSSFLLFLFQHQESESFLQMALKNQEQILERVQYSDFYGMDLMNELAAQTGQLDVNSPIVFTSLLDFPKYQQQYLHRVYFQAHTSQVWLDVVITRCNGEVSVSWSYVKELFSEKMITEMANRFLSGIQTLSNQKSAWKLENCSFLATDCLITEKLSENSKNMNEQLLSDKKDIRGFLVWNDQKMICPNSVPGKIAAVPMDATDVTNGQTSLLIHGISCYETGYMGYYEEDGSLLVLGKADFCVFFNGKLCNLDRMESLLLEQTEISDACVIFDEKKNQLLVYYVANTILSKDNCSNQSFPVELQEATFHKIEKIPRRLDGSVDRKRLLKRDVMKKRMIGF